MTPDPDLSVFAPPPGVPPGKRWLAILCHEGDLKVTWDPDNGAEVEAARAQFDALRAKGHAAFRVDPKGRQTGERLTRFDPEAAAIIMVPQIRGG